MPLARLGSAIFALLLACAAPVAAQQPSAPSAPRVPADTVVADSARVSARGALLRSLVLPGWGQAYVGAAGRGAVYFAMEAGSLWMAAKSRRQLGAAREQERAMREAGALPEGERLALARSRAQQVEDWITLAITLMFFSAADAYVSAQLLEFPEHLGAGISADGTLRLQARVPISRP